MVRFARALTLAVAAVPLLAGCATMMPGEKPVTVSGELGIREYEGKTYLTIRVNDLDLQGGKPQDSGGSSGGYDGGHDQPRNGAPAGGGRGPDG